MLYVAGALLPQSGYLSASFAPQLAACIEKRAVLPDGLLQQHGLWGYLYQQACLRIGGNGLIPGELADCNIMKVWTLQSKVTL